MGTDAPFCGGCLNNLSLFNVSKVLGIKKKSKVIEIQKTSKVMVAESESI